MHMRNGGTRRSSCWRTVPGRCFTARPGQKKPKKGRLKAVTSCQQGGVDIREVSSKGGMRSVSRLQSREMQGSLRALAAPYASSLVGPGSLTEMALSLGAAGEQRGHVKVGATDPDEPRVLQGQVAVRAAHGRGCASGPLAGRAAGLGGRALGWRQDGLGRARLGPARARRGC